MLHCSRGWSGSGWSLSAWGWPLGAISIPSAAGYAGVGPNFLPWLVSLALVGCGAFMLYEVRTGGFRHMEESPPARQPYWSGFVWMSAGMLVNAALITTHRLHLQLYAVLCAGGAGHAQCGGPGKRRPEDLGQGRCHRAC